MTRRIRVASTSTDTTREDGRRVAVSSWIGPWGRDHRFRSTGRATRSVAGIVIVALESCTGAPSPEPPSESVVASPRPAQIRVIGADFAGPKTCQPRLAAELVQRFLLAISRGDDPTIVSILAPEPRFQWYSASFDDHSPAAFSVSEARALLQRRAAAHEEGRLLTLSVQFDPRRGMGHIAYALALHADDVRPASDGSDRLVEGKGAIDCATGKLMVWSMGTDGPRTSIADAQPYCRGAHDLGEQIIACGA